MTGPEKPFEIPGHWHWSTFQEVGEWSGGGTPSKSNESYWDGTIPWVSPKDMKRLEIRDSQDHVTEKAVEESSTKLIPSGSVLFVTRSGILERTLPTAITIVDATINQDLKALSVSGEIDPIFVLYYSRAAERSILRHCAKDGTTVASLESSKLYGFPVPIPPLEEQRRIVSKIEELFSNLEAGLEGLETAKRQLERYQSSVLQAGVEGRLTANWRRSYSPESADQLLERILEERQERWEEDYREKYQSKGKEPPEGWRSRYSCPDGPEDSNLPDIPTGWKWAKVEQISIVYSGVTKNASKSGDLVSMPYLRVANVYANELRLDDVGEIEVRQSRLYKYLLQEGDLLVVEGNGSKSQIGRVARWDGSIDPCVHQNHLIKVRPVIEACGRYLLLWMLSPAGREHIMRVASSTSGLYTLSLTKVRNIPVPLPPLGEQRKIVDEVSRLLSIQDDVVNTLKDEARRGKRLRKSVLRKAFSGRLVSSSGETVADGASGMNGKPTTPMHQNV